MGPPMAHTQTTYLYHHRQPHDMKYVGSYFEKGSSGAAGYDLKATATITIAPGQVALVPLSAAVALNEGTVGLLAVRSSTPGKGLMLANGIGIIDSDYRGTLKAALYNFTDQPVTVHEGDTIGQLVPVRLDTTTPQQVDQLDTTPRGDGGFGSTTITVHGKEYRIRYDDTTPLEKHIQARFPQHHQYERLTGDLVFKRYDPIKKLPLTIQQKDDTLLVRIAPKGTTPTHVVTITPYTKWNNLVRIIEAALNTT
ncbi:MAG: dUTP diphosphatase [Caldilineae bacterium]|nr:MAG: dUTP diphosphatase [Caldilineae bacterium]